jgi:hypothetical protein
MNEYANEMNNKSFLRGQYEDTQDDTILDPRMLSPLYLARSKRNKSNVRFNQKAIENDRTIDKDVAPKQDPYVEFEGYRFPKQLNNPWAISKVLIQKKDKLSMKEIRSSQKSPSSIKISAQVKVSLKSIWLQAVKFNF